MDTETANSASDKKIHTLCSSATHITPCGQLNVGSYNRLNYNVKPVTLTEGYQETILTYQIENDTLRKRGNDAISLKTAFPMCKKKDAS